LHFTRKLRRLLPLLPPREERAGERRVILLVAGVWKSIWIPLSPALSPLVPRGERESVLSPILLPP
jgi:hypothetical protein